MLTSNARLNQVLRSKYVSTDAHSVSTIYSDKKVLVLVIFLYQRIRKFSVMETQRTGVSLERSIKNVIL